MGNAQIKIVYPPNLNVFYNLHHGKMEWRNDELGQINFSKKSQGEITFQSNNQESGQFSLLKKIK